MSRAWCSELNEVPPPFGDAVGILLVSLASGPGSDIVPAAVKKPVPSTLPVPRNTEVPETRSTTPSPFTSAIPHSMCRDVLRCDVPRSEEHTSALQYRPH